MLGFDVIDGPLALHGETFALIYSLFQLLRCHFRVGRRQLGSEILAHRRYQSSAGLCPTMIASHAMASDVMNRSLIGVRGMHVPCCWFSAWRQVTDIAVACIDEYGEAELIIFAEQKTSSFGVLETGSPQSIVRHRPRKSDAAKRLHGTGAFSLSPHTSHPMP